MLQLIIFILPLMAVIAALFTLAGKIKRSGSCVLKMLKEFGWFIENSPSQVAFFMFSITAAIAATLIACAFSQTSKQLIITLDIIYLISRILLILLHRLNVPKFISL
jgi:uncharacterized MAPEG superfamily protein